MILVSACLLGFATRYNAEAKHEMLLEKHLENNLYIPFCPEQMGGLSTPRDPVEIVGGNGDSVLFGETKVLTEKGYDVTKQFMMGIEALQRYTQFYNITAAILKEGSPSCGVKAIYDGTFSKKRVPGYGVATAYLRGLGIPCYSEETITEDVLVELIHKDKGQKVGCCNSCH